jgi:hypothetical protein
VIDPEALAARFAAGQISVAIIGLGYVVERTASALDIHFGRGLRDARLQPGSAAPAEAEDIAIPYPA